MNIFRKKYAIFIAIALLLAIGCFIFTLKLAKNLLNSYQEKESAIIFDRNNKIIEIRRNKEGYYAIYSENIPKNFEKIILKKEDNLFYFHPGINLWSLIRSFFSFFKGEKNYGSSTISQQLAKILLKNEGKRNLKNKLEEAVYALSLETHFLKKEILKMYSNSIYFGNSVQGAGTAAQFYFNTTLEKLTPEEILSLITTINNPSNNNPFSFSNKEAMEKISSKMKIKIDESWQMEDREKREKEWNEYIKKTSAFELGSMKINCEKKCQLSVDLELSEKIREILKVNLNRLAKNNVSNGAVVIIKTGREEKTNELLAIIGSPDPRIDAYGYKINMAIKPRPIGSTVKPFIYLKGFEKGLRPYTLVEDKEYKYIIGSGFAFYPKNYDYQYHGVVSLNYALGNSLNVPTVKTLEYVGLENFYDFLEKDLKFNPVQDLKNYQLGIALGGLEADLLALAYYFSIFPNEGELKPLKIYLEKDFDFKSAGSFLENKKISEPQFISLVNKILSDRKIGIDQFGLKSNLNLEYKDYAVKTGTSREFHDSWTIGYTSDFIVGVWLGNSDDTAMDNVSGSAGAGKIWSETMNIMLNSEYNKKNSFNFSRIKEFDKNGNIEYGLSGDDYDKNLNLLLENNLIESPHDGDEFLLENNSQILLKARGAADWSVNGKLLGSGEKIIFSPKSIGEYEIKASNKNKEEIIKIILSEED